MKLRIIPTSEGYFDVSGGKGGTNPKSTFWQDVKSFFGSIFGGKKKQADVVPIAGAAATPIYVGELEKIGRVLTMEQVTAAIGTIFGKSLWALPLMLNGDSAGARGYDIPLTDATDVPADEPEKLITLFRGVHGQHPDLANAYMGMAIPWGGFATAKQHNLGDNNSMFTSWSTSIDMANLDILI